MDYSKIDEAMLPFFEYVQKLSEFEKSSFTDEEKSFTISIESVSVETPFELDIQMDEDGKLIIGASPPLYYVQTTVTPVFHSMKIKMMEDMTQQNDYGS